MNPLLVRCGLLACGLITIACCHDASAQTLRYQLQNGQKFSYRIEITVDTPDSVTSYKGVTHYTVQSSSEDQIRLLYQGGLMESEQPKTRGPQSGFPRFPEPPRFPFDRPTFAGKTPTTNQITMSTRGQVLAIEGDSQLPFLIGNVSLLPFEPLPESDQNQWTTDGELAISQSNQRDRFGPFAPWQGVDQPKLLAATEETTYTIEKQTDQQWLIRKVSRLSTPAGDGNEAFESEGNGTWTFDPVAHLPVATDYQTTLKFKQNNIAISLPIAIKFERLSATELAKLEQEQQAKTEALAKAREAAKLEAQTPLTAEQKKASLEKLGSDQNHTLVIELNELAKKQLKDPDAEIAAAIESLVDHPDRAVSMSAKRALARWSPEFERKQSLTESYQGPGTVPSTDLPVTDTTKLFVGQILQVKQHFWYPAIVEELLPDGTVKVARRIRDRQLPSTVVPRSQLQLAPPELTQPAKPVESSTLVAESRTWTDVSGRFKLDAVFVGLDEGKVSLRGKDGRVIVVPLAKLCQADQAIIQQSQDDSENPFAQ